MANKALTYFFMQLKLPQILQYRGQSGAFAFMLDLQTARFTLVLASRRALPAMHTGDAPLAWSAMS